MRCNAANTFAGLLLSLSRAVALHASATRMMTTSAAKLILGSKSSTRKLIVKEMGFSPIIRTADIDEKAIGDRASDPEQLVLLIGTAKADALLPVLQNEAAREGANLLLTGDQVVVHAGTVLEKPADYAEVRRNIAGYALSPCRTVGSAVLTDLRTGQRVSGVDSAEIHFKEIPAHVVDALCEVEDILWCAGGLMIEHPLVQPYIERIDGTVDSVMGLSKALVLRLMQQLGDESSAYKR